MLNTDFVIYVIFFLRIRNVVTPLWNVPYEEQQTVRWKFILKLLDKKNNMHINWSAGSYFRLNMMLCLKC